ncbi:MAG: calcium/sodium antiporter [Ruminococcaceae bacterium]|nr:calcium/sodium antiporter [Oscillospiraceae bacterium]
MEYIINLALIVLGFIMLSKGADWFVDGAVGIATKLKIPQIVIGLTIVAMGTSAPEAAVSISSALKGSAEITIGNVVGSNIINILIILGISAVITTLAVQKSTKLIDIPVTLGITVLLLILGLDGSINLFDGIILLVCFVAYLAYLFIMAKKNPEDSGEGEEEGNTSIKKPLITALIVGLIIAFLGFMNSITLVDAAIVVACFGVYVANLLIEDSQSKKLGGNKTSIVKSLIMTAVGLVVIIFGSNFAVDGATALAKLIGISDRIIGLTIIALGTSLPELFTSVTAAMKKNTDIAIGNIVGSNIFNFLMVVGLSAIIIPVPFAEAFRIDMIFAIAAVVILLVSCFISKKVGRVSGIVMLLTYVVYFVYLLTSGGDTSVAPETTVAASNIFNLM